MSFTKAGSFTAGKLAGAERVELSLSIWLPTPVARLGLLSAAVTLRAQIVPAYRLLVCSDGIAELN